MIKNSYSNIVRPINTRYFNKGGDSNIRKNKIDISFNFTHTSYERLCHLISIHVYLIGLIEISFVVTEVNFALLHQSKSTL